MPVLIQFTERAGQDKDGRELKGTITAVSDEAAAHVLVRERFAVYYDEASPPQSEHGFWMGR